MYNRSAYAMPVTIKKALTEVELLHPVKKEVSHYVFSTFCTDYTNIKRPKESSFLREVEIIYLGELKSHAVFQLLCMVVEFKGDTLQDVSLLRKINYVFDEVIVLADQQGNIVEVNNHREILKRWTDTKTKLLEELEGDAIFNYFNTIDAMMDSKEKLISFLGSKDMYGLYFNGYWGKHHPASPRSVNVDHGDIGPMEVFESDRKERGIELRFGQQESDEYKGRFHYQNHQLMEAVLELSESDNVIKYKVLCLGLREY